MWQDPIPMDLFMIFQLLRAESLMIQTFAQTMQILESLETMWLTLMVDMDCSSSQTSVQDNIHARIWTTSMMELIQTTMESSTLEDSKLMLIHL